MNTYKSLLFKSILHNFYDLQIRFITNINPISITVKTSFTWERVTIQQILQKNRKAEKLRVIIDTELYFMPRIPTGNFNSMCFVKCTKKVKGKFVFNIANTKINKRVRNTEQIWSSQKGKIFVIELSFMSFMKFTWFKTVNSRSSPTNGRSRRRLRLSHQHYSDWQPPPALWTLGQNY